MKLYQRNELKDARIFFDKKPPIFLTIFIIFTLFLVITALLVSSILSKTYIVEAQGTITTEDNTYLGSLSDGILVEMKCPEGTMVNKDDVLFTVSNGSEGVQYQSLTNQLEQLQQKITVMDKYIDSLNKGVNKMSNSGLEQEYYGKVEYYLTLIKEESNTTKNNQEQIKKKEEKKQTKQKEITDINTKISTLTTSEEDVAKKEELTSSLETKQSELESLQTEIEQLQQSTSSQANQTKLQLISEVGTARTTVETSKLEIEGQLAAYKSQDSLLEVKANQTGYVHYLTPLKQGMAIQKTQTIAEISKNEDNLKIVEAYINATDITKVKVGDDVNIAINGVNTQKYGTLKAKLEKIDIGTITQETSNGNVVLYRCTISIKEQELKASNGETIKAIKSMPVVARIIYEKETYLDWILELLSFTK